MSKVSIIIPVYNVAAHVEACLRSVMTQTYQDLEILVCDDGSADGSGEICDRLAAEDARIQVMHIANSGVSAARNTCLDLATGDYIAPVDSDDLIEPDYIEQILTVCEEKGTDIAFCDYQKVSEDGERIGDSTETNTTTCVIYTNTECLEHMYHPTSSGMSIVPWGKIYRRSLFEEPQIRYPVGQIHEDQSTTFQLFYAAHSIGYLPMVLYSYRIRSGSIMRRAFHKERAVIVEATRKQCEFFLQHGERRLAALAVNNHLRTAFSVLANLREMQNAEGNECAEQVLAALRTDCKKYLPQVDLAVSRKVLFRIAAAMPLQPIVQRLRMF